MKVEAKMTAHAVSAAPLRVEVELAVTEAAWDKVEARLRALPEERVREAPLDLTVAAALALEGAHNLLARREELDALFTKVPWEVIEGMEDLAHAAQHAELLHRAAQDIESNFADLLPRANELRAAILLDLAAQVRRKRAPEQLLADVRAGDGSVRDKANDLNDMGAWYAAHWSEVEGRTTVERAELDEAVSLGARLLARLGTLQAARAPREGALSTDALRRRAFAALREDHEVVRRYGCFLFWSEPEGWDAFVPPLWAGVSAQRS